MTVTIANNNFDSIQLPVGIEITTTSFKSYAYLLKEIDNKKSRLLNVKNINELDAIDLSIPLINLNNSQASNISSAITELQQYKIKLKNILRWKKEVDLIKCVTQREIDIKAKYIKSQTDKQIKTILENYFIEVLRNVEIVTSLDIINKSNSSDVVMDELYNIGVLDLFNTSKSFTEKVVNNFILLKPFKSEQILKEFINEKLDEFNSEIQLLNSIVSTDDFIQVIKRIDQEILLNMPAEKMTFICNNILKSNRTITTYTELKNLINTLADEYNNKIIQQKIKSTISEDDFQFFNLK